MISNRIAKAALKPRNLGLLVIVLIASAFLEKSGLVALIGIAAYVLLVVQTLGSVKFGQELKQQGEVQTLGAECDKVYREINKKLDKNLRNKAITIINQKDELVGILSGSADDPVKERIVEQALKLVLAYLNLTYHYSVRTGEISTAKLNDLIARINYNNRKLGTLTNYEAVLELTKTVEMDEKLLLQMKEEKEELEMVNVKLDHIESTIDAFKHQLASTEMSISEADKIEEIINEATALDTVLSERNRAREKI